MHGSQRKVEVDFNLWQQRAFNILFDATQHQRGQQPLQLSQAAALRLITLSRCREEVLEVIGRVELVG